jgi:hypothetical protein
MTRKVLLLCGVLSSIAYVAADLLSAIFFPGYHSFTSRAISELMASGAPTERLVDPIYLLVFNPLLVAFGVGVWVSPGPRRLMRLTGGLIIGSALLGFTGPTLFEMNVRGGGGAPRADLLHIAVTGLLSLIIMVFMGVGAFVRGPRFRWYSLASIAVMLVFGALTGVASQAMAAGQPTPWMGLLERICIGAYLLWVAVLAITLLRPTRSERPAQGMRIPRGPLRRGARIGGGRRGSGEVSPVSGVGPAAAVQGGVRQQRSPT